MTTFRCWRDPSHTRIETTRFGWPQCAVCRAAPAYHERPSYLPDDLLLDVLVPTRVGPYQTIDEGSAVVGVPLDENRVLAYYEGWIHGQYAELSKRERWEHGVLHAAGRMVTNYPTVATAHLDAWDVTKVGTYNPKTRELVVTDEDVLRAWLA